MGEATNTNKDNASKKSSIWILVAIIALLITAALGFLYSKEAKAFDNCQAANQKMKQEMQAMNQALSGYIENETSNLKTDFKQMLETYDELIAMDALKADSLQAQKDSIQVLLSQLKDHKVRSYRQINKLKKRNQTLRDIMHRYIVKNDSLLQLTASLNHRLDETSSALTKTQDQRDKLMEQNKKNAALLTKGARLTAFGFSSKALRYRNVFNGTTDVTRAKKADILSSSFSIGANKIAPKGDKLIYMQIITPNGQVLYKRSSNITQVAGQQILYTGKREINYQGKIIDMSIVYNLEDQEIESGNYTVKIFADGALIGKDTFTLK